MEHNLLVGNWVLLILLLICGLSFKGMLQSVNYRVKVGQVWKAELSAYYSTPE